MSSKELRSRWTTWDCGIRGQIANAWRRGACVKSGLTAAKHLGWAAGVQSGFELDERLQVQELSRPAATHMAKTASQLFVADGRGSDRVLEARGNQRFDLSRSASFSTSWTTSCRSALDKPASSRSVESG